MFRVLARGGDNVERELERDILVRFGAVEQRDSRGEGLEVEVVMRVFQAVEENGDLIALDMGLAALDAGFLDNLLLVQFEVGGNIGDGRHPAFE